ncbi:hypothetical protein IFM89_025409 [Coptis chinensis]|uniref:Uncharacterized protein n=1 Tax=Coptis chinensis TaxID=261450 RepID=A0A835LJC6_9MAGN|nr:hypothetical protein IFM89_025409 [Coptis chinensis]
MCCKRFNNLSNEDTVWSTSVACHFPLEIPKQSLHQSSKKALYIWKLEMYINRKRIIKQPRVLSTEFKEIRCGMEEIRQYDSEFLDMVTERNFAFGLVTRMRSLGVWGLTSLLHLLEIKKVSLGLMDKHYFLAFKYALCDGVGEDTNVLEDDAEASSSASVKKTLKIS